MLAAALVALLAVPACTQPDQDTIRVALERHLDYGPFAPYSGVLSSRQGAELPTALPEGFEPADTLALDLQQEVALARAARLGATDTSAASNLEHLGLSSAAIGVLAQAASDPFVLAVSSVGGDGVWLLVDTDNDEDLADEEPEWLDFGGQAVAFEVNYERVDLASGTVSGDQVTLLVDAQQNEPGGRILLAAFAPQYWAGRFEVGGQDYQIAGRPFGPPGTSLLSGTAEFVIAAAEDSLLGPSGSNLPYHAGELVALGSSAYELASVADGGALVLVRRGPESLAASSRPGARAPDVTGPLLNGDPFALDDLRGRYVVLDFWGTWCVPCIAALPPLRSLHTAFVEPVNGQVMLVGVAQDPEDAAAAFVAERGIPWFQLAGEHAERVIERYAISAFPTVVVIGPDGRVLLRAEGDDAHPDHLAEFFSGALGSAGDDPYHDYTRSGNATVSVALPGAAQPLVAGSFTEWSAVPMFEAPGGAWSRSFHLAPGRYAYKLIVNGDWVTDPSNPETTVDPEGNVNSVLVVE